MVELAQQRCLALSPRAVAVSNKGVCCGEHSLAALPSTSDKCTCGRGIEDCITERRKTASGWRACGAAGQEESIKDDCIKDDCIKDKAPVGALDEVPRASAGAPETPPLP